MSLQIVEFTFSIMIQKIFKRNCISLMLRMDYKKILRLPQQKHTRPTRYERGGREGPRVVAEKRKRANRARRLRLRFLNPLYLLRLLEYCRYRYVNIVIVQYC